MQIEDMKVAAQKHQYPVTSTWAVLEDDRGLFWRQNKKLLTSEQADRLAEQIRQAALEHDDGPCHVCGVCFFWSCAEGVSLGDCIHSGRSVHRSFPWNTCEHWEKNPGHL